MFSIDDITNTHLWPSQVHRLPRRLARFLGANSPRHVPQLWVWLEVFVSTFCGIAVVEAVFRSHTVFSAHHPPVILASYGASAILCFNVHGSPLAQPRNVVMGQLLSSVLGLCVQKLFSLSEGGRDNYWLGGALSVALSSVAMSLFNCVHPPGGASALMPCLEEQVREMSWWYIPVQLVSSVLMLGVACLFGNLVRSYPVFWWSAGDMGAPENGDDESVASLPETVRSEKSHVIRYVDGLERIEIDEFFVNVPSGLEMGNLEKDWVASLQKLLRHDG